MPVAALDIRGCWIDPKKIEVLKELIPDTQHVALLNDSTTRIADRSRVMAAGTAALGLQLTRVVAGPRRLRSPGSDSSRR